MSLIDPLNRENAVFLSDVALDKNKGIADEQVKADVAVLSNSLRRVNAQNSIRKSYLDNGAPVCALTHSVPCVGAIPARVTLF